MSKSRPKKPVRPTPEAPAEPTEQTRSAGSRTAASQETRWAAVKQRMGQMRRTTWVLVAMGVVASLAGGWVFADWYICLPEGIQHTYVGRASCVSCHPIESEMFQGSHHDMAMDVANSDTVLADFNDALLEHDGRQTRFFMKDSEYWVRTEGPDGNDAEFQVTHVFGVEPLQQYIVEMNRPDGLADNCLSKAQVLRASWDTTKGEWFYLRPPDVDERIEPGDPLHWTGITQCWNTSCADCHSTQLVKGYDVDLLDYRTTFSEIDVSCEACHGPASTHVELAEGSGMFWDRRYGKGIVGFPKSEPRREIETCARCHSRRFVLDEQALPGEPFCNANACELPSAGVYYPDGQILDEDYEFGSFTQSKMYHNRIRCSDCHDPHAARTRYSGNAVCTSCHQHSPTKYDVPAHHHHQPDTPGAQCVNCHMPESYYMEVDGRRDHSIRIPRPDLSVDLHTPNACTQCHLADSQLPEERRAELGRYQDWLVAARAGEADAGQELARIDRWSADAMERWYGPKERPATFAPLLNRAWSGDPEVEAELAALAANLETPVIIRATALQSLAAYDTEPVLADLLPRLEDDEPMIVATAIVILQNELRSRVQRIGQPGEFDQITEIVEPVLPLLTHSSHWVRNEAARLVAILGPDRGRWLSGEQQAAFDSALRGFEATMALHGDRAGSHLGLGLLYEDLARFDDASAAYRTGIRVEPDVVGPRSNLANLLERQADAAQGQMSQLGQLIQSRGGQISDEQRRQIESLSSSERRLRTEIAQLRAEELPLLQLDASRAPDLPALQYRLGMLLYLNGRVPEAALALDRAYQLEPSNIDYLLGLTLIRKEQQDWEQVRVLVEELVRREPSSREFQLLRDEANRFLTPVNQPQ